MVEPTCVPAEPDIISYLCPNGAAEASLILLLSVSFNVVATPVELDPDKETVHVPGFNLSYICNLSTDKK